MKLTKILDEIVNSAIVVHSRTGPGLWEKLYQFAMICELEKRGLHVERERAFDFQYDDRRLCDAIRVDLIVENLVVLELKAIEKLRTLHLQQCSTYLALTGLPAGMVLNFNVSKMKDGIRRCYPPRRFENRTHYGELPKKYR